MDVYEAKQPLYDEESQKYFFPMISINSIYPIGSIYLSVNNVNPTDLFGGTWEQIAQGRTLLGANDSDYIAGQTIEAGLPNITGYFSGRPASGAWNGALTAEVSGAFDYGQQTGGGSYSPVSTGSGSIGVDKVDFDASLSNSIYGNSTTVQPPAFVVYMWKRIE